MPFDGAAELRGCKPVLEGVDAVDEDDGNLRRVAALEFGVGEDVDLLEGELVGDAGALDFALRVFAEVAAGFGVETDVRF